MSDAWRMTLRAARRRLGLNLYDTAERAHLSYETVRGYENGRRRPTRDHLLVVLRALQATQAEVNEVLHGAGFAPEQTLFPESRYPSYYFVMDELDEAVETVPWPQFVANDTVEVVAANTAAQAVWDIDIEHERRRRTRPQMNLLSVASDHHFADRIANWDDVIAALAAIFKGQPHRAESLDEPSLLLHDVLTEFAKGDQAFLARMIGVWASTEAWPPRARQQYRVVWVDRDFGEMRFLAQMTTCSEPDGFSFNDWHPIDAGTWAVLEQVKKRWSAAGPLATQA